jgi:hypothetical protein
MRLRVPHQGHRPGGSGRSGAVRPRDRGGHYLSVCRATPSKKRTARALAELFGVPLSSGTVAALTARAAGRLDGFLERVRESITAQPGCGLR